MVCSRVLFNIDERLSQNMNKVDLFIGRKLQAEERVRNGRCDARTIPELLDRLLHRAVEPGTVDLKPEGRENLAQLPIRGRYAIGKLARRFKHLLLGLASFDEDLEAMHLNARIGQRLRDGIVKFACDRRAFLQHCKTPVVRLPRASFNAAAECLSQRLTKAHLPVLRLDVKERLKYSERWIGS